MPCRTSRQRARRRGASRSYGSSPEPSRRPVLPGARPPLLTRSSPSLLLRAGAGHRRRTPDTVFNSCPSLSSSTPRRGSWQAAPGRALPFRSSHVRSNNLLDMLLLARCCAGRPGRPRKLLVLAALRAGEPELSEFARPRVCRGRRSGGAAAPAAPQEPSFSVPCFPPLSGRAAPQRIDSHALYPFELTNLTMNLTLYTPHSRLALSRGSSRLFFTKSQTGTYSRTTDLPCQAPPPAPGRRRQARLHVARSRRRGAPRAAAVPSGPWCGACGAQRTPPPAPRHLHWGPALDHPFKSLCFRLRTLLPSVLTYVSFPAL